MTTSHHLAMPVDASTGGRTGRLVAPSRGRYQSVGMTDVQITDGFWADMQRLNARAIIPHCESWVERTGWAANFDAAVDGRLPGDRRGREFSDSEIYKLLEAMAWELAREPDESLAARYESLVARVAAAQEPDGYLNTMFGRPGQGARYSDLQWGHELYCFGHLIQAGVARLRTHGSDQLVEVALRAADHVCETFGSGGIESVCGHPVIEVALVELARATGQARYLDQARLFVERRGHGVLGPIEFGAQYFQDDVPVRDQTVLDGHAVRAGYLAAGAVDLAIEDDDAELLDALQGQVRRTLARRTYLTGGWGAHHEGESFGQDFELPPDRSYSETCAGVSSVMVNHRLLLATGESLHADAVERVLYNVIATSPAADGQSFFYTNRLQQREPGAVVDPNTASARAASSLRAPWFHVSCCPGNVARTLASLGAYVASASAEGVQLHHYASAEITAVLADSGQTDGAAGRVRLRVTTDYPAEGRIRVEIIEAPGAAWTLSLRVPHWAEGATITSPDGAVAAARTGYADVHRVFEAGDVIVLDLPLTARWTRPDPRIDAVRGQVAVERGPVVYCAESIDAGEDVGHLRVDTSRAPRESDGRVTVSADVVRPGEHVWPYGAEELAGGVDSPQPLDVELVPYRTWGNRGPGTMRVWIVERAQG